MKTKALTLFLLALALLFSGCSTTPTTVPVTPRMKARSVPLPPMPPGFTAPVAKRPALRQAAPPPAPTVAYVPGSPPMEFLDFGPDLLVRVLQQTNTVVRIKQTETLGGELQEIAVFECLQQPEAQWVATTVGRNHPQLFVAGSNEQCQPVSLASRTALTVTGTGRKVKSKDGKEWWMLRLAKTGANDRALYLLKPVPPKK